MNKIIKTFVLISSLAFGQQALAAACSAEPIKGTNDCWGVPDTYTITLYEMGVCNDISDQSSTVPDIATSCQTAYLNTSGSTVNVENNVTGELSGGTTTRPDDNTYAYGFIKVDAKVIMKHQATFAVGITGSGDPNGNGTTCWTNGNQSPGGETTDCGTAEDANPQNMNVFILSLLCGSPVGNFYCRYENDAEGLDNTYAWLVDANGNASTNPNYSEAAGDVKYLIGIAKFNEPKAVNDTSTGMQAQYRVSRGLNVDFTLPPATASNEVNFNLQEFKVITTITTD
jgi:hypothetical protein